MDIIYGSEQPKISLKSSPKGGISFHIENSNFVQTDDSFENISWFTLENGELYYLAETIGGTTTIPTEPVREFINTKFLPLTTTEYERKFLELYIDLCVADLEDPFPCYQSLADYSALIPQVWVNWLHYDNKDTKRAERVRREPFRVDFLIKGEYVKGSPLIIEIDGASHFGAYAADPHKAMLVYTEHLRKDRWLRKQGWNVVRLSNYEVESCKTLKDFRALFEDLTGWQLGNPWV